jgi:UDP-glucose 4-epimerase
VKYLLLGGGGFIGNHLCEYLRGLGHRVCVIDNLSTGVSMPKSANFSVCADILTFDGLEDMIKGSDAIYWLAGSVGVLNVVNNPRKTLFNNLELAYKLIPLFEKYNKRVIFTSTSEVYSDGPFSEGNNLSITPSTDLRGGYACAKLMTEFMITSGSFPYTILRLFNVTGPGQLPDYGMVLPRFIEAVRENRDIVIHGSGSQVRAFCHIQDALVQIKQVENINGEVFNIGCDENAITISELASRVIELSGSRSNIIYKDIGYSDIKHRIPDLSKLKSRIDYRCNYSVDGIILDMLKND